MNTLDAIASLTARIGIVRQQIDRHRQSILDLEAEAQRLAIALGVMQQLEASSGSPVTEAEEVGGAGNVLSGYSSHVNLSRNYVSGSVDLGSGHFKVPFVTGMPVDTTDLALS